MNAVGVVLNRGLHYSEDVFRATLEELGPDFFTAEDLLLEIKRVERGTVGMEIYYARDVVEHQRQMAAQREAVGRFKVGDTFKDVRMNFEKFSKAVVEGINLDEGTLAIRLHRRGTSKQWTATVPATHSIFESRPKVASGVVSIDV